MEEDPSTAIELGPAPTAIANAFEELFRREYATVVRSCRAITRSTGTAEEAAQEGFARALQRWDRVRHHDNPAAWVTLTALRFAVRQEQRDRRRHSLAPAWSPADGASGVDPDLVRALGALSTGQREAVVLHHLLGLPVAEVAEVLRVSAGTVKTQLHRGRARLAELLAVPDEEVER